MKTTLRLFSVLATTFSLPLSATMLCGGGEGPKPLTDFAGFKSDAVQVHTEKAPKDFMLWEGTKRIVYRNEDNQLYASGMKGENPTHIGTSSRPIAHLPDYRERYVITEDSPWILDTWNSKTWLNYKSPFDYPRAVFWDRKFPQRQWLYAIKSFYDLNGSQTLQLSRYREGTDRALEICSGLTFKPGNGYHIAEGHAFPNVLLYRVNESEEGTSLRLYWLNVENCRITSSEYPRRFEGTIESVHWFEPLGRYAVKITHPERNLMWSAGTSEFCTWYNIGIDTKPLALNHKQPILASVGEGGALDLIYLSTNAALRAPVAKGLPIAKLTQRDLKLTNDGRTLYMTPTLIDQSRGMVRITLPQKQ